MKKLRISFSLLAVACILILSYCKKDSDETPTEPSKIKVNYHCDITGPFLDLKVIYLDNNHEFKEISVDNVPWDLSFDDFNYGDSVYIEMKYKIPPDTVSHSLSWKWAIQASEGSNYIINTSQSTAGSGVVHDTIYRNPGSAVMILSKD